jgi:pantoate--beta-alanine ligase
MEVIGGLDEVRKRCAKLRRAGVEIGLVPTMGALHAGHEALIRAARADGGCVVVSIFVNPTQFGPNEDYEHYPRPIERDLEIAERVGADLVFTPAAEDMYVSDRATVVRVERLTEALEGASRPRHFDGVTTVVAKLFCIVMPDRAYFGEKDFQQLRVIQRMVTDLNMGVRVIPVPTVREADGLAMSSRNAYLNAEEREAARLIPASLEAGRAAPGDDPSVVRRAAADVLGRSALIEIDYISIVDDSIREVTLVVPGSRLCVAVRIGKARLIDNCALGE